MNRFSRRQFLGSAGIAATFAVPQSASTPRLALACADYLRFTPLATGDVRPKGFELDWVRGPRNDMLRRATSDPEIGGGEASMLQHLLRVDQGDRSLVAVPVFLLRNFPARDIYTKKGSSLAPTDLNGRRLGIYNWAASGAVWYRHFLRHLGRDPSKMKWVVGGADEPGRVDSRAPFPSHVEHAPADRSLSDLLLAGEIDAMLAPIPPSKHDAVQGPIARLFPDFQAVETTYFEKTRCYPPQHVLLLRKAVWERDPSIGKRLVDLFQESEKRFLDNQRLFPYASPWLIVDVEEADRVMGKDYFAHGLEKNREPLEVFCRSGFEDGLTKRRVTVEEYFAEFLNT